VRRAALLFCLLLSGCGHDARRHAAPAAGMVTYCAPDFDGTQHDAVTAFNRLQPQVKARLVAFGPQGHEVADQLRKAGAAGKCDIVMAQDTAVPAMAAAGELRDLTAYLGPRRSEFFPATLAGATYGGRAWAVPRIASVRLLFSQRAHPPLSDWRDVYRVDGVMMMGGVRYGPTIDFLELAHANGGRILDAAGTRSELDSEPNRRALAQLRDAVRAGRALNEPDDKDEQSRHWVQFLNGRGSLIAAWDTDASYDFALSPRAARRISPVPIPGSVALTQDLVVPRRAPNPRAAMALLAYLTGGAALREQAQRGVRSPLRRTYRSPVVLRETPAAAEIGRALERAIAQPATPAYEHLLYIVDRHVRAVLAGREAADVALERADAELDNVLPSSDAKES
jgi:multiple sugar transport system substrate-binding protein